MRLQDAITLLQNNNINPLIYGINSKKSTECYVIEKEDDIWLTYYWEKGKKESIETHVNESEAVRVFLQNVVEIESLNMKRNIILK